MLVKWHAAVMKRRAAMLAVVPLLCFMLLGQRAAGKMTLGLSPMGWEDFDRCARTTTSPCREHTFAGAFHVATWRR